VHGYLGGFAPEWRPLVPSSHEDGEPPSRYDAWRPDFTGAVLFTSGSSGPPQAIPKTLLQLAAEVATLEKCFGAAPGQAEVLTTVSHQHIYGLLFQVLWPLSVGRPIHTNSFSFFEELVPARSDHDWILVSSPAHLKRLPENGVAGSAVERLCAVFSSGGPLPFEVAHDCKRILHRLPNEVYGSSETGGVAWRRQVHGANDPWVPFPDIEWRVDARDDVLEIRSPHVAERGWVRTADKVAAVEDGFVLKGRVDRIVKIESTRVSLNAIEAVLIASPLVDDVRVLMVTRGHRERMAAVVVPSQIGWRQLHQLGRRGFNRVLSQSLTTSIQPLAVPRLWRYIEALPVNSQGKTTHAELLSLIDQEVSRPRLPVARLISKDVRRVVFELIPPRKLLYFDGHFPGYPVLPGIVQLDWVIYYGRQYFDLPPRFHAIHGLKFQRIISPQMPVEMELLHEPGNASLSFCIKSQHGSHAKGRILFGAAHV
jgi:acyl-coenzyme A synthetase/AMP-(fatty) acid ligase